LGTVVSAAEESNNLLKADSKYWVWGSYNEDPEEYVNVQDDGSFFLRESGVAFVGEKVGNGQKISVKFSTNKDQWAAIQIRGNLTPEMAASQSIMYSEAPHAGLAVLLRPNSNEISINASTGGGASTISNKSGTKYLPEGVTANDGNDHVVDIETADAGDGKISINVYFDGTKVIDSCVVDGFADASYVSVVYNGGNNSFILKDLSIEGVDLADYQTEDTGSGEGTGSSEDTGSGTGSNTGDNAPAVNNKNGLLNADKEYWIFGTNSEAKNQFNSDGSLTVTGDAGIATFTGETVGDGIITLKFKANNNNNIVFISLRNNVTLEKMEENGHNAYPLKPGNKAVSVLIRTDNSISINVSDGAENWSRLGDTAPIKLNDGVEHTMEIHTKKVDNKLEITVIVDGVQYLQRTTAYLPAGYVSFCCVDNLDSFTVTDLNIEGVELSDYQSNPKTGEKDVKVRIIENTGFRLS
jgi:hypothetical protein